MRRIKDARHFAAGELVIALRDVAGLAWGGTEMSSIENGDFMHFDCRLTDFGNDVYQAGRRNRGR